MPKTYIVEHLDEELGAWSELEYVTVARETGSLCLSSLPPTLVLPADLTAIPGFRSETRSVEELYGADEAQKARVCLLDPSAKQELAPADGDKFDVFLFGGSSATIRRAVSPLGVWWSVLVSTAHCTRQPLTRQTALQSCARRASRAGDWGPSR